MITIKCTASEKRKLCSHDYHIMCAMMNALGHCEADCGKCKRRRKDYITWEIISKPKKKAEGDGSSCHNCYWNTYDVCCCTRSPHWLQPIKNVMKVKPHCNKYSAYEGDG